MMRKLTTNVLLLLALMAPVALSAGHGDIREKIAHLNVWIKKEPNNSVLYLRRGELFRISGSLIKAAADYDRALSLNPALHAVHLARARLHLDARQLPEAEVHARRFLKLQPKSGLGWITLGRILHRRHQALEAARAYDRGIACLPRVQPRHFLERAQLLRAAGAGYREEALAGIDAGLKRLKGAAALQMEAVRIERALGRPTDALQRVVRLAAHAGRKEPWLVLKAEILLQAGRPTDARLALRGALSRLCQEPERIQRRGSSQALMRRARAALVRCSQDIRKLVK